MNRIVMILSRLSVAQGPKLPIYLSSSSTRSMSEAKVVQPPNPKKITSDMVGPPDPVSNLRKIIFREAPNESALEKRHRQMRAEVQKWNHNFWTQHNSRFFQVCNNFFDKFYNFLPKVYSNFPIVSNEL